MEQGVPGPFGGGSLGGITYPSQFGGGGLTAAHEKIWREVKAHYPMPDGEFIISHGMCLPMLTEYGTARTEANASLPTTSPAAPCGARCSPSPAPAPTSPACRSKAELDGDEWVINGQKVWTTLAHKCDYGLVVARTDPDQVKHAGISMFIIDMKAPGVEIRPIHQIDGGTHFNEVFFTDVRIPKDWLVGELNTGWRLATSDAHVRARRHRLGAAPARSASRTFKELVEARPRPTVHRQPGRARSADADLLHGDHEVDGGDADPRRA